MSGPQAAGRAPILGAALLLVAATAGWGARVGGGRGEPHTTVLQARAVRAPSQTTLHLRASSPGLRLGIDGQPVSEGAHKLVPTRREIGAWDRAGRWSGQTIELRPREQGCVVGFEGHELRVEPLGSWPCPAVATETSSAPPSSP